VHSLTISRAALK
jgi:hypothetical protein